MELVLVRHADVSQEGRGRCYGRLEIPLSEAGRDQSRRLAERLAAESVRAVVSSPSSRALETAAPIAEPHGVPVTVVDELREVDFGAFEGRTYDEIASAWPELYALWMTSPARIVFPDGEALADLGLRVHDAVARLRAAHDGQLIVAVTHAGVVRAVLGEVLGLEDDRLFRVTIDPASLTRIQWLDDVAVVRTVNVTL